MKILIVDDMDVARVALRSAFENEGFEVDEAKNGKQTILKVEKNNYDYVILDLGLPDMNGIEILKKIKKLDRETKVIILTGESEDKKIFNEAVLNGVQHYLLKPVNPKEILGIIKNG